MRWLRCQPFSEEFYGFPIGFAAASQCSRCAAVQRKRFPHQIGNENNWRNSRKQGQPDGCSDGFIKKERCRSRPGPTAIKLQATPATTFLYSVYWIEPGMSRPIHKKRTEAPLPSTRLQGTVGGTLPSINKIAPNFENVKQKISRESVIKRKKGLAVMQNL